MRDARQVSLQPGKLFVAERCERAGRTAELQRDLEEVLRKHGGTLDTIGHPTTTLEDYFLRIVEESKAHPGRRYLPGADKVAAPAPLAPGEKSTQIKEK